MLSEIKKIYIIQRKDIWFAFSKEQYGEMKDDVEGTRWCLYKSTMKDVLFFYELLQKSGWNIKKYAKIYIEIQKRKTSASSLISKQVD